MKKEKKCKREKLHYSTLWTVVASCLICLVVLTFSFTISWGLRMKTLEETSSSNVFKEFDTQTIYEEKIDNNDIIGAKITAFNIWETTCPACLGEMGALEELSKKYPADEFRLVGVCADVYDRNGNLKSDQIKKAQKLMDDAGVSFTNIIPTKEMLAFFKSVIPGYPTTFFVDSSGHILEFTSGSNDYEGWVEKVDEVLANAK